MLAEHMRVCMCVMWVGGRGGRQALLLLKDTHTHALPGGLSHSTALCDTILRCSWSIIPSDPECRSQVSMINFT